MFDVLLATPAKSYHAVLRNYLIDAYIITRSLFSNEKKDILDGTCQVQNKIIFMRLYDEFIIFIVGMKATILIVFTIILKCAQ